MGLRIVACGSNQIRLQHTIDMLQRLGHHVVGTSIDGQVALDLLFTQPVDMAILDEALPRVKGRQVIRAVMAVRPLPLIIVCENDDCQMARKAAEAGAAGFLVYPFTTSQLAIVLEFSQGRFERMQRWQASQNAMSIDLQLPSELRQFAWLFDEGLVARDILYFFRSHQSAWYTAEDIAAAVEANPTSTALALQRLIESTLIETIRVEGFTFYHLTTIPNRRQILERFFDWTDETQQRIESATTILGSGNYRLAHLEVR
ncbi:MAG: response regulator [Chloroflexi bacterium]|nr:response regulator [Chloroflexota bacterium]